MKITIVLALLMAMGLRGQHTFSIVAVDTTTSEVGIAGASCVDLTVIPLPPDVIGELFPGKGAIVCQGHYNRNNQLNARRLMKEGKTPNEIIQWLIRNDADDAPNINHSYKVRQYGIAAIINNQPKVKSYSGPSLDPVYNIVFRDNYAIQGNSLLENKILTSMEQGFINTKGDLACKLMGALQGAKKIGADIRCKSNGTSSLAAFLKVAKKTDSFGSPSLNISVKTAANTRIEPIDSLQKKFNLKHNCSVSSKSYSLNKHNSYQVFQNPITDEITITTEKTVDKFNYLEIRKVSGKFIYRANFKQKISIPNSTLSKGLYIVKIIKENQLFVTKVIKN